MQNNDDITQSILTMTLDSYGHKVEGHVGKKFGETGSFVDHIVAILDHSE